MKESNVQQVDLPVTVRNMARVVPWKDVKDLFATTDTIPNHVKKEPQKMKSESINDPRIKKLNQGSSAMWEKDEELINKCRAQFEEKKAKESAEKKVKAKMVEEQAKPSSNVELKMEWTMLDNLKFRCDNCQKSFSEFNNFRQHHNSVHLVKIKNISCEKCDKKFHCKRYLRDHMRNSHGIYAKMIPSTSKPKATKQSVKKEPIED